MPDSPTEKKSTVADEYNSPKKRTYKVWVDIEEYDELTESGIDCDAPGGELATFDTYEEAYDFAEEIDNLYSTHRTSAALKNNAINTEVVALEATSTLPHCVAVAIDEVLSYLWESERTDYEDSSPEHRAKHIFCHLKIVSRWLRNPHQAD